MSTHTRKYENMNTAVNNILAKTTSPEVIDVAVPGCNFVEELNREQMVAGAGTPPVSGAVKLGDWDKGDLHSSSCVEKVKRYLKKRFDEVRAINDIPTPSSFSTIMTYIGFLSVLRYGDAPGMDALNYARFCNDYIGSLRCIKKAVKNTGNIVPREATIKEIKKEGLNNTWGEVLYSMVRCGLVHRMSVNERTSNQNQVRICLTHAKLSGAKVERFKINGTPVKVADVTESVEITISAVDLLDSVEAALESLFQDKDFTQTAETYLKGHLVIDALEEQDTNAANNLPVVYEKIVGDDGLQEGRARGPLQDAIAAKDAQIVALQAQLCLVNAEKYRIQHQYWDILADEKYRVYTKICNCIDAVIPKDSGRRNLVKGAYYGLKWFYKRFKNPEVNRKPVDQALKSIARPDESRKIKTFGTLEVPRCEDPIVSIVIPVYNQFAYTYCCIRSVIANSGEIPYEVIIADDCSTDQTVDAARYIKNVRVVRTKENLRFLRNCNNAAKQARGKYILFLNNDTVVHKGWLKSLVDLCERDPKVGVTGSKLVYPDGVLQEAGGILWRDGSAWNFGRGKNPFDSEYCYVKECDYISGAALMVRKTLWDEVGGFDERFAPAYYEDTDFCFEARKHGYKVVFQPASLVTHFEGRSNGTDLAGGLKKYQVDNQKKFYEKWQSVLEEHAPNGVDVFTARDRSARRQHVFLVDHYIPTFDKDAGGRQIYFYLKTLAEMGFQVHLLGDNSCHDEPYTSTFQQMGIEVLYGKRFCPLNREAWFMENGKYLDFAFLHRPHIAINYINMVRSNTNAKIIFFGADVGQVRIKREYEITGRQALLNELKLVKQQEDLLYGAADVNLCVGSADADFVRKTYPGHPVFNIPLFIYDEFREKSPSFGERKDIVFVGGFNHRPNVDAVQWFVKEIFPKITTACPGIKFHVVGSNVPSDIKGLASEQVIIEGFLPDEKLWGLYDKCRLTIAPLRYGAGVKGKVIDAMYFRSVVVTTSIGAEGIPQEPMPFAIADDAAKFADAVITLYQDAEAWEKLHRDSLEMIKANYSLAKAKSLLNQIFTK